MPKRPLIWLAALLLVPAARAEKAKFKVIHVADLAAALKSANPPAVFDANVASTRENAGIIPGARLLSSSSKYDVAQELPGDKNAPLVFYCANTMCTASHDAAEKAVAAGYTDVSVMVDGIFGWRDAGRTCAMIPRQLEPKKVAGLVRTEGAVVVDVRENEERYEVVPDARWFPMSQAADDKAWGEFIGGLPKGKTVVFYCASGKRAKRAAEQLGAQGVKTAYFESADQWKAAGLSVEKGPAN